MSNTPHRFGKDDLCEACGQKACSAAFNAFLGWPADAVGISIRGDKTSYIYRKEAKP